MILGSLMTRLAGLWAMTPEALSSFFEGLRQIAYSASSEPRAVAKGNAPSRSAYEMDGPVAIVPVRGELSKNGLELWGFQLLTSMGLARFPQSVANEIFEQSVNLGRGGAGKYLQRLCNALNYSKADSQRLFTDLVEDGAVGPKTLDALSVILARRSGEADVVHVRQRRL